MDIFQSILLGIVQGLSEFLPISSSGHLVVFQKLLGVEIHSIEFDVAAHIGTVLSILVYYRKLVFNFVLQIFSGILKRKINSSLRLLLLLFCGSIPTAIIGLSLKDLFESLFHSPQHVGVFLIITGILLFLTKSKSLNKDQEKVVVDIDQAATVTLRQAFLIGLAQGAAIAPGISRSGSTIAAGIFCGLERNTAAMFSFILSVPAVLGAGLLKFRDISVLDSNALMNMGVGLVLAFFSGLLGLWIVLSVVRKGRLEIFSYYLWILGPAVILFL